MYFLWKHKFTDSIDVHSFKVEFVLTVLLFVLPAAGRCQWRVFRATPCPSQTQRGSYSNTRPRPSRHGLRSCWHEQDNTTQHTMTQTHMQYTHTHGMCPGRYCTHTLWPSFQCEGSSEATIGHRSEKTNTKQTILFFLNFINGFAVV